MKKVFEKISSLSYPTVLFIATSITLVTILPLWIYLTRQQTDITTRAVTKIPVETRAKPSPVSGPVPLSPPVITTVYPWIGKVGDVIIIEGRNFGVYPKNRRVSVGGVLVPDTYIIDWTDTRIELVIPQNPQEGLPVSVRIDTHPIAESVPLVFYDEDATIQLIKQNAQISVSGVVGTITSTLYTQNGKRDTTISAGGSSQTLLFTLNPGEEIRSIVVTDDKGTILPYYINPTNFGF